MRMNLLMARLAQPGNGEAMFLRVSLVVVGLNDAVASAFVAYGRSIKQAAFDRIVNSDASIVFRRVVCSLSSIALHGTGLPLAGLIGMVRFVSSRFGASANPTGTAVSENVGVLRSVRMASRAMCFPGVLIGHYAF
jgi:hypothetical protein